MIRHFRHKGLKRLYDTGSAGGVRPEHIKRLRLILADLDAAAGPDDMDLPGHRLHPLKGRRAGFWSVAVSGNWRIVFRFEDRHVVDVDYLDYH